MPSSSTHPWIRPCTSLPIDCVQLEVPCSILLSRCNTHLSLFQDANIVTVQRGNGERLVQYDHKLATRVGENAFRQTSLGCGPCFALASAGIGPLLTQCVCHRSEASLRPPGYQLRNGIVLRGSHGSDQPRGRRCKRTAALDRLVRFVHLLPCTPFAWRREQRTNWHHHIGVALL